MDKSIRPLGAIEREAAVALWQARGLTRPWNDPLADFDRAVCGASSAVLGVLEDETLIGTVMVGEDGHRGWVYYLAVSESRGGQGIGSLLMAAAEDWLRARGVPRLNLMVRSENEAVIAFYRALGYVPSEVSVLQKTF